MNHELSTEISSLLRDDKLMAAIELAEGKLKEQMATDFNRLLGKDLLHLTDHLVIYISDFYEKVENNLNIKAIYAEMNGFTINYDLWFLDLFAYDHLGGIEDTDWLADWEKDNSTDNRFPLTGFEELQLAYQDYMENQRWRNRAIEKASDVAELLIVLRLQELMKSAVTKAKQQKLSWAVIPVFVTAHDYDDMIYKAG